MKGETPAREIALREDEIIDLQRIQIHLHAGKFLILPPTIYKMAIEKCREYGFSEEELAQIHESKFLPFLDNP